MPETWQILGMLGTDLAFGLVYAFLVVRRVNASTQRITHYEVIVGVAVVLLIALLWGVIDFLLFALLFVAFAAAGFPMWLEYESRATAEIQRKDRSHEPNH